MAFQSVINLFQAERVLVYLKMAGVIAESPVRVNFSKKWFHTAIQVILVANKADLVRNRQVKAVGNTDLSLSPSEVGKRSHAPALCEQYQ